MVRIVDGEIVQDDDPRLTRRASSGGSGAAAAAPAGGGRAGAVGGGAPAPQARSVFDFSAPPLRVVPDTDGTALGGLPGLAVFGARVPPQHLLMLAAVLLLFGWKGALVCALLWYWMQSSSAAAAGRPGQQLQTGGNQAQRMAEAQDYFQRMMGQAPLGRGGSAAAGRASGRPSAQQRPAAAAADPWAARGKPHRLNDPQK